MINLLHPLPILVGRQEKSLAEHALHARPRHQHHCWYRPRQTHYLGTLVSNYYHRSVIAPASVTFAIFEHALLRHPHHPRHRHRQQQHHLPRFQS